ncbi:MAG: efflux RND transporter permease subunit, partial [Rhodospirillales bacterium]|nr:efflux RND transporter permease subunit [Rhodospirillales bacterium]
MNSGQVKLGLSGILTRAFISSPLTPLLLLISLGLGIAALMALPREEEPQISVPVVDIQVNASGLKAPDAVELVTKPLEDIIKGINAVEHVYSRSEDDRVVVTARFEVGTDEDVAILRIHDEIRANIQRLPLGIPDPLIIGRGINDVPIVTLTLSPDAKHQYRWTDNALREIAEELLHELNKINNVGLTFIVGGSPNQIRVEPDPERLSLYGVTLNQLVRKIQNANRSVLVGSLRERDKTLPVITGQTLSGIPDIGLLLMTSRDDRPVYVKDVADVIVGAAQEDHRVWHLWKDAKNSIEKRPAVTLALAKRKGANAVIVADEIMNRLDSVRNRLVPSEVKITVTRNYGETATDKSDELLFHLGLATVSIVILISIVLGWREGVVVAVVVPTTILLTLFASWAMGYTINRVSLFALIFSIGILVDDAIVVVENIVRHWRMGGSVRPVEATIEAVAEVGNPTIVATLTIVAALLPMMFVSGLMGPYMSPIPANASAAMIFSFFVAVILTPWLLYRVSRRTFAANGSTGQAHDGHESDIFARFYRWVAAPLLTGRQRAKIFLIAVAAVTIASCLLFVTKNVTVKLLPFDNKSEIQVVVDLPEGGSLETTERILFEAAERIKDLPELIHMQVYAGTSMPFNFNGLVRHYYLREHSWQGDLQVNLLSKDERDRASHAIALDIRKRLADLNVPEGTSIKVVEVPPGPPVLSTLLAEIYGPDAESRRAAAVKVREAFRTTDFIVDVDDSFGQRADRLRFEIDQENLEFHGVQEQDVYDTITALFGGVSVGYSHRGAGLNPVEISIRLPKNFLSLSERILSTPIPAPGAAGDSGAVVELGDVVRVKREKASYPLFRRNGRFAELVTGELAGRFEAPLYGMLAVEKVLDSLDWAGLNRPRISYAGQPEDESVLTLLWDGEWEVTYVTFRDMGLAF